MRELLIAEMKRALELLEKDVKPTKEGSYTYDGEVYTYHTTNREFSELKQMLRSVRRHSVAFEKDWKGKTL